MSVTTRRPSSRSARQVFLRQAPARPSAVQSTRFSSPFRRAASSDAARPRPVPFQRSACSTVTRRRLLHQATPPPECHRPPPCTASLQTTPWPASRPCPSPIQYEPCNVDVQSVLRLLIPDGHLLASYRRSSQQGSGSSPSTSLSRTLECERRRFLLLRQRRRCAFYHARHQQRCARLPPCCTCPRPPSGSATQTLSQLATLASCTHPRSSSPSSSSHAAAAPLRHHVRPRAT
jgi:hypothetical protein